MNCQRWAELTRSLTSRASRRLLVARLVGVFASSAAWLPQSANAKRRRKRKRKPKITRNDFGCVNVGNACKTSDQCCSGICGGKQGKKRCQAHDQSTCQGGEDYGNGGPPLECDTSAGDSGLCVRTTGNAGYCEARAYCHSCNKDADCVPFCGPRVACLVCNESCPLTGTACASVANAGCTFP